MVSVNLIFHVVSALTFAALIWYLLHMQAQLTFLRTLTDSLTLKQPKVVVDWPHAFLRKFAAAQAIPFVQSGAESPAAQKMDLKAWAEAHARLGVQAIDWAGDRLRLTVRRNEDLESWGPRLEGALQGKIKIEWIESSPSVSRK